MSETYAKRMDRIMAEDAMRRLLRDGIGTTESRSEYDPAMRGIGVVRAPRRYRNTVPAPRTRVVGVAAFSADSEHIARLAACDVDPTVAITRNGVITIVDVTRRGHTSRKRGATRVVAPAVVIDTARITLPADTFQT